MHLVPLAAAAENQTVMTGALLAAVPVALLGGLVSFFSPCVLPLVPGYMSYVTGVTGTDLAEARRGRMLAGASSSSSASPPSSSPAARSSASSGRTCSSTRTSSRARWAC